MDCEKARKIAQLPRRIKGRHSQAFRSIKFESNYFYVTTKSNISEIYIFRVCFEPSIPFDNSKLRTSLLQKSRGQIASYIPNPIFSGSNIYSNQAPKQIKTDIDSGDYKINIKQVKVLSLEKDQKVLLHFLNNALRNLLTRMDYSQIGRSGKFFHTKSQQNIDTQLNMFHGVKANFMKLEKGIYLRVDSAKKIVRNQTVLEFINSIYSNNKEKDRDEKRNILKEQLCGQTIMTNYGKTRYLKVVDIIFETVDEVKLDNGEMTLREFYDKKYNRKINHAKQPLLIVESKNKNQTQKPIIIPQFCLMTGIPDSFDEFKRKKVSEKTIKSASQKRSQIQKFMREVQDAKDFVSLKNIGVQLDHRMETIKGKLIPAPKLALGQDRSIDKGRQSNFQLFRDPIYKGSHSLKCGIIATKNVDLRSCIDTFKSTSQKLKVNFEFTTLTIHQSDRRRITQAIMNTIDSAVRKEKINVCFVVIPNFLKHNYQDIKKQCLQKSNVISQCAVESTLKKKNLQSIATKILLQMIAKRGNILWVPKLSTSLKDTMIMAFDKAKGSRSTVLSCCATINETFSSIFSKTASFQSDEEKFQAMKKASLEIINQYAKKNDKAPKQIIMFHNTSSGDQVKIFKEFFLEPLNEQLDRLYHNGQVSVTFIMVNTKTSQRFFSSDNSGVKNVQAGTLVSDDIVSQNYDFYLVSQFSTRGSLVPNHYKVVYSNSKLEQGIIQQLAYSQCFNYVNWTGSIKVPGILQYAKKCAKFSADALGGQKVCGDLEGKLYFV